MYLLFLVRSRIWFLSVLYSLCIICFLHWFFVLINFVRSLSLLLIEVNIPFVPQGLYFCLNYFFVIFLLGICLSRSFSIVSLNELNEWFVSFCSHFRISSQLICLISVRNTSWLKFVASLCMMLYFLVSVVGFHLGILRKMPSDLTVGM